MVTSGEVWLKPGVGGGAVPTEPGFVTLVQLGPKGPGLQTWVSVQDRPNSPPPPGCLTMACASAKPPAPPARKMGVPHVATESGTADPVPPFPPPAKRTILPLGATSSVSPPSGPIGWPKLGQELWPTLTWYTLPGVTLITDALNAPAPPAPLPV